MFGGGFGRGGGGNTFSATYRAFPLAFIDKQSAEYGDKVILPPSALDRLGAFSCGCRRFSVSLSLSREGNRLPLFAIRARARLSVPSSPNLSHTHASSARPSNPPNNHKT